jgi:hypothetical protein
MALLLSSIGSLLCQKAQKLKRLEFVSLWFQFQGQRREQGESEVEYGAVKVAPGPRRTLETNVDECVYAQPRRTRP